MIVLETTLKSRQDLPFLSLATRLLRDARSDTCALYHLNVAIVDFDPYIGKVWIGVKQLDHV